jgi:hypothetical protein
LFGEIDYLLVGFLLFFFIIYLTAIGF